MLESCLEIFERHGNIDKLILDTYVPAEGTYIVMHYDGTKFVQEKWNDIKQNKKDKSLSISPNDRVEISRLDYYCKLIDMNKPLGNQKIIQSNSYLGFVIKKESLTNGKLTDEIIDRYYSVLKNPRLKYSKKQDLVLYESVEAEIGAVDVEKVSLVESWIYENVFGFADKVTGKGYFKIFFVFDDIDFEVEGRRYYIPNIYNKNDYNIETSKGLYGLPNNNMGLNSKKTYLEHKDRKSITPLMESYDKVMRKKKLFDYLMNQAADGKYNIYMPIDENKKIIANNSDEIPDDFQGYKLRLVKEKNEAAIIEADFITSLYNKLPEIFEFQNILDIPIEYCEQIDYGQTEKLEKISTIINEVLFSKYLKTNMYNEPKDMSIKDAVIKKAVILYRTSYANWFYKGYSHGIENIIKKSADMLIRNSVENGNKNKAMHQINLKWSLLEYFEGGEGTVKQKISDIREELKTKIISDNFIDIESDDEYSYAVGQLLEYLISLNKSSKKTFSLGNRYLGIKNDKQLKEQIRQLFIKYNHSEDMYKYGKKRISNLLAMVMGYEVRQAINYDLMLAGYVSKNVIYTKKQEDKENE